MSAHCAYVAGDFEAAHALYADEVVKSPSEALPLLNRAHVAIKLGARAVAQAYNGGWTTPVPTMQLGHAEVSCSVVICLAASWM